MTDLSTYSGQKEHYSSIRRKFASVKEPVEQPRVKTVVAFQQWPPISLPRALPRIVRHSPPQPPRQLSEETIRFLTKADMILGEVAEKHDLSIFELKSHRRNARIVAARQEAMWRLSRETTLSLPQIAKKCGGFDHTTALHSIRKHEERMKAGAGIVWYFPENRQ
jgi:hypothetical protein